MQYLYDSGDEVVFMDEETYDQFSMPRKAVEDALPYIPPSSLVQMLTVDGSPSGVQLPSSVELAGDGDGAGRAAATRSRT